MAITNLEIINALNIEAEYTEMGIKFASKSPNSAGWLSAWPMGKSNGKSPSASVSVNNGVYKDFSTNGETLGFFDFAAKHHSGGFKDWKEARIHFAKEAGLSKRLPRKDQQEDSYRDAFTREPWNERMVGGIVKKYTQFSTAAIQRCGGKLATYPKNSKQASWILTFGCYSRDLIDSPPRGYACLSATGHPIMMYKGEGNPPEPMLKFNKGQSGLVGHRTLSNWDDMELIWKVEGLSDLIAMEEFIPEEFRDRHGVVTNSSGAGEIQTPFEVAPIFAGKKLGIIHDCDKPGQDGVQNWSGSTHGITSETKNVVLPYEIEEKSGKDLRDWIEEGHSYAELLAMYQSATAFQSVEDMQESEPSKLHLTAATQGVTEYQMILKKAGCVCLGELENSTTILCFSEHLKKTVRIKDLSNYHIVKALQNFGAEFNDEFCVPADGPDDPRIPFSRFKKALAIEASNRQLTNDNQLGVGIWKIQDYLFLVNKGEVGIYNGKFSRSVNPIAGDKILDIGGATKWYEHDRMNELISKAENDPEYRKSVFKKAVDLFSLWDNFTHDYTPQLLAAMVCCSYVQSVWAWRPYVALCGPSNSGKTLLMQRVLLPLFGDLVTFSAKPTEAGLRQAIGYSSKVAMIDEFEADKNRRGVLELLRTSGRGIDILKGTADQTGTSYRLHHIPWMGAIEMGVKDAADRNRYLFVDLNHVKGKASNLETRLPSEKDIIELGQELCAIAVVCVRPALGLFNQIKDIKMEGVDRRVVDSNSLPASMMAAINGENVDDAKAILDTLMESRKELGDLESDEQNVIDDIMTTNVGMARGIKATIGQLMESGAQHKFNESGENIPDVLERNGIKVSVIGTPKIHFHCKVVSRILLKDTDMRDSDLATILRRVPGMHSGRARMSGGSVRCLSITHKELFDYMGWEESKIPDSYTLSNENSFGDEESTVDEGIEDLL